MDRFKWEINKIYNNFQYYLIVDPQIYFYLVKIVKIKIVEDIKNIKNQKIFN